MNNKTRLRNEIKNLYGGANKFLTNAEINKLVEKSTGQNNLNIKKEAYKQAYSKYYNHVFDDILYQAFMRMKASPQCPTGVSSEPIRRAAERAMQKRFGTGATYAAGAGAALGYGAGWVGNRAAGAAGKAARGVAGMATRTAGALAQLCKQNPKHSECNGSSSGNNNNNSNNSGNNSGNNNGNNQNRRQNGRPSRSTAGQAPARFANGNRRGAPKSRSRY